MNPQKIIVKFPPGAGGMFLSLLISSLYESVAIKNYYSGHANIIYFNFGHTGNKHFADQKFIELVNSTTAELKDQIEYIHQTVSFYSQTKKIFVFPTHIVNLSPLATAFGNSKIVEISHDSEDQDQLAFNLLEKHPDIIRLINNDFLPNVKNKFDKLKSVESVNSNTDKKLLTYIIKFGLDSHYAQFIQANDCQFPTFQFRFSDFFNGHATHQLENLINFIDPSLLSKNDDLLENTTTHYKKYAESQLSVPWKLHLDAF